MGRRSNDKHSDQATRLLADPTRFKIYYAVLEANENGVTTAEIAESFDLHRNVARMHLEKLVRAGMLKSILKKPQGGGRPAREYHIGETVTDAHPPRDYRLLADVALTALRTGEEPRQVARRFGRQIGNQALMAQGIRRESAEQSELIASLEHVVRDQGLFARIESNADQTLEIIVLNCTFKELSPHHGEMTCDMHNQIFLGICESHFGYVRIKADPDIANGGPTCSYQIKYAS